jgi:prevent-host-death family protein
MLKVGVARLKAELSGYLKKVRRGQEVVVCDRETPIARLIPFERSEQRGGLIVRPPTIALRIQDVPLPPPLPGGDRIVEMLINERQQERDRLF